VHRRLFWLFCLLAFAACEPNAPPPASETVRGMDDVAGPAIARRIRIDGLIEAREWANPDTIVVLLPDGRNIRVLQQRGPDSLDFAFLGLGGNAPKPIYPEILLDVSGRFPPQFGRESWWFRIATSRCVAHASTDGLECGVQLAGFEASAPPRERQDALEVRISFSLLEFNPTTIPEIAFALRFADDQEFLAASWPLQAELVRPDTWSRLNLAE
jgi:hypothetical protein